MINFIKKLFGGNTVDYKELVKNGAQIVDVRTPAEYSSGSIPNSKNILAIGTSTRVGKYMKIPKNTPARLPIAVFSPAMP